MNTQVGRKLTIIIVQVKEVGSGASQGQMREKLIVAARRREIDVVPMWRVESLRGMFSSPISI